MLSQAVTEGLIAGLAWYLPSALLLSLGCAILWGLLAVRGSPLPRTPERGLALAGTLLVLALVLPVLWRAAGTARTGGALVEVWNGPRIDGPRAPDARLTLGGADSPSGSQGSSPLASALLPAAALFVMGGALLCLGTLLRRRRRLGRHCAQLPIVKRVGRVCLCACDRAPTPFAARFGGVAFIVIPTALWADSGWLRMVIAHEVHHHRRGDLRAALVLGCLRALFFWNPLLAVCERVVAELQDLACDRGVLRRLRVPAVAYGRMLVWAAEAARGRRYVFVGSRGVADGSATSIGRRIDMLDKSVAGAWRVRTWLVGAAACALLVGISWIAQGAVADHRVTRAEIQTFADRIQASSGFPGFPILVDDQVAGRINQWVAEPETRDQMRAAMARMPTYRGMIETVLRAHRLPVQLLGVVMAESRFDNEAHPNTPVERRSAGLWQFVPSTGRRLALQVSPAADERLDPRRATEAAATLLAQLFARYQDWLLAVAAYNAGEKKVDALTAGVSSKAEARARVLAGDEEHARYVRAVMAAIILIDNPSLLN